MSSFRLFVYFFVLSGIAATEARSQDIHGLYHNRWTVREGAPRNITTISADPDGFLWVGTDQGLYRFDGVSFESYKPSFATNGELSEEVSVITVLPSGLWVGLRSGGISVVSDRHIITYGLKDGLGHGAIRSIAQMPGGPVWVATSYGLSRFDGKGWHNAGFNNEYPHSHPDCLFFDSRGTLWASTSSGLVYLLKNEKTFRLADPHVVQHASFSETADGRVWFASRPGGVRVITTKTGMYSPGGLSLDHDSSGILADRTGALWFTTVGEGLYRVEASALVRSRRSVLSSAEQFNEVDGLTADFTEQIVEDREGSVWVSSEKGLDQFHRSRFTSVALLPGSQFIGIAIERSGQLIVGSKQISRTNGQATSLVPGGPQNIGCVYGDPEGNTWLNSRAGLWRLSSRGLQSYPSPNGLRGDSQSIQTMSMDGDHRLWASFVNEGLYRLSGRQWTQPAIVKTLPFGPPIIAFTETTGKLWFGYPDNEVATLIGNTSKVFSMRDGVDVGDVRSITEVDGRLWIGGAAGLEYQKDGRFTHVNLSGTTILEGVSGIVEGAGGDIWLNTMGGIFRLAHAQLDLLFSDPHHRILFDQFTYLDGIPGYPDQVRPLPNAIRRSDGRLYFATRASVVWIDPSDIQRNAIAPAVAIRSVSVDGRDYRNPLDLILPVRTKDLSIDYAASSLLTPERVRFRYRIEGSDESWQDVGRQRQVSFHQLPPGRYRFHVIASNDDGLWNNTGAKLTFFIPPSLTQRTGFKVFCAFAFFAFLWLLYWVRIKQVKRLVKKRLMDRVSQREDIARDLHDTFLQATQGLILSFHTATSLIPLEHPGRKMLDDALDHSDRVLHEGRNIVTQLRSRASDEDELFNDLTSAGAELGRASTTEFRLHRTGTPRELHSVIQDDIYLIGREAICNVFRHAKANVLIVELNYGAIDFVLEVKDDGIGIEKGIVSAGGRVNHWGLPGMRERAERIGATLDLKTDASTGTSIALCLPIRFAYCKPPPKSVSTFTRLARRLRGIEHD